jgi:predicted PolB exonuclease-like 3'-5' exonuclease
MKAKITSVEFAKEWGKGLNKLYYYNVWLENQGTAPWNIGTKQKEQPDFLQEGKVLEYEYKDESKRTIKRLQTNMQNQSRSDGPKKPQQTVNPDSTSLIRNLDNYNEADLIFIDIETVRAAKELQKDTPLYEAWEYKSRYNNELERKSGEPVTIEDYFKEKAALYAPFAKVVTIVVGRIKDEQLSVKRYNVTRATKWDEKVMLEEFNNDMKKVLEKNPNAVFVGWANFGFDQPFLNKRMIVNGIQPIMLLDTNHLKPWDIPGIDLKEQWKGSAFYPDSLIAVAVALGLASPKSKMDGSEVGEYYYAGKIDEIVEYCVADVLTTANVYRKFVGKSIVELK